MTFFMYKELNYISLAYSVTEVMFGLPQNYSSVKNSKYSIKWLTLTVLS